MTNEEYTQQRAKLVEKMELYERQMDISKEGSTTQLNSMIGLMLKQSEIQFLDVNHRISLLESELTAIGEIVKLLAK